MKAEEFIFKLEKKGREAIPQKILFWGEEEYWLNTGISMIKQLLFTVDEEQFNRVDLDLKSVEGENIIDWVGTPPFFGSNRLVILRGLENLNSSQETSFLNSIERAADGVIIIITARHLDRRKKFIKKVLELFTEIQCSPLKAFEARKWVMAEAKKMGLNLSMEKANYLIEIKGTSLSNLKNELIKMQTFMGEDKQRISAEEWESLLGEASEANIFQMMDGALEGKPGEAIILLKRLLAAGEPEIKILAMLGGQIRRLMIAWILIEQGRENDLQKELACHPYMAKKLRARAQGLTYQQLRLAHQRVLRTDYKLKTGAVDPQIEMEMVLLDLGIVFTERERVL